MQTCPACAAVAFERGQCLVCGHLDPRVASVRTVSGQRVPVVRGESVAPPAPPEPPPPLDPSAMLEVGDGPSLPGFEPTALVAHGDPPLEAEPEPAEEQVGFAYASCPRCRTPQPNPPNILCEHCGYRVTFRPRGKAAAKTDRVLECRDCGTANPPDRTSCVNCGFRLYSAD